MACWMDFTIEMHILVQGFPSQWLEGSETFDLGKFDHDLTATSLQS